jgi:Cu/Ag efflux protein CusF
MMRVPRKLQVLAAVAAVALALPAMASDVKGHSAQGKPSGKKPSFQSSTTATATATVDSVDPQKRTVTFHTPDGELETVQVGDNVKNLGQVKPGDLMTITYHEYSRLSVYPAGAPLPETSTGSGMTSANPGEKPEGAAAEHFTLKATVEKLDKKTGQVTLKDENGQTRSVTARNKKNLENVEVGDQVVVTHERAVAASIKTPKSSD